MPLDLGTRLLCTNLPLFQKPGKDIQKRERLAYFKSTLHFSAFSHCTVKNKKSQALARDFKRGRIAQLVRARR